MAELADGRAVTERLGIRDSVQRQDERDALRDRIPAALGTHETNAPQYTSWCQVGAR